MDIAGLVADTIEIAANPANPWAWGALGADVACLILPGISGGGGIVRFVASSDNILDAAKYVDDIVDADKAVSVTKEIGQKLHKMYDPIGDTAKGAKKRINQALSEYNSRIRPDGLDSANRIIYELKLYNRRSFLNAVKQTNKYAKVFGGNSTIVIDMYLR
ncbi:MAG: hypothetical protein IKA56_00420 [Clostridia bacterium]|nr:hypothetical protein [Clostridia bacterium]